MLQINLRVLENCMVTTTNSANIDLGVYDIA